MADEPNGAAPPAAPEPKRSLREVLEASWDTVVEGAPDADGGDPAAAPDIDSGGQPRDEHGRWARRDAQPGEAAQPPQREEHPAPPEPSQQAEQPHPAPAQPGPAAQPPENWSAEDRAAFEEQTEAGKAFLLRRHSQTEGEFQRRIQATTQAANFAQSLAPIFNDPRISRSLSEAGVGPAEAINQWAGFHVRFLTDPVNMIGELIQRARIDPAVFAGQPAGTAASMPGVPPEALKDPTMRFIADQFGRQNSDLVALRNELQAVQHAAVERQQQEVMRVTRWGIDAFAAETDDKGQPLRPDFDAVLPHIIELFKANPKRDLREAYETARWMHADTRTGLIQRERAAVQQRQADQRAAQAVRSNATGRTHPVAPPPRPEGQKRSLRETLEAAADQVGLE